MKQLSILFILFLLYSFTTITSADKRTFGPETCNLGYIHKCASFGWERHCKCFEKCPDRQELKCSVLRMYEAPSCSCEDKKN